MCVPFYVLMPVLESKQRELIRQLPEGLQDRYLLGSPEDWIKILKEEGEEDMHVPDEAGDRGQGHKREGM